MTKKSNVHTSHCCASHGCKYGDEDCPVYIGQQEQEYPCEECGWEEEDLQVIIARKPKIYDSHKIFCDYHQMRDNLHLFLLEKGIITDAEQIISMNIDWNFEKRFLYVKTTFKTIPNIAAEEFEGFVERGFKL